MRGEIRDDYDGGAMAIGGTPRPEVAYPYPSALRAAYKQGKLFRKWAEKYQGHLLITEKMWKSRQIPHSGPIKDPRFFLEIYLCTQYLDAGYGALCEYRHCDDPKKYAQVCTLVGGDRVAQLITPNNEKGGRPPDLLVYDLRRPRFRFVECKDGRESLKPTQMRKFPQVEALLNAVMPPEIAPLADARYPLLFPDLPEGHWIHIARLEPC
jgi:hypothetical protein